MRPKPIHEGIIIAGFGGQGVVLAGRLLAQAAMLAGKEVTYIPAYGAEVRGGTSNCSVVISDEPIACPIVSQPDVLVAMNKASLSRFGPLLNPHGVLIYNSSISDQAPHATTPFQVLAVPADQLAVELGNQRSANMVMLGATLQIRGILELADLIRALPQVLAARYHGMIPVNTQALKRGAEFAAHAQASPAGSSSAPSPKR